MDNLKEKCIKNVIRYHAKLQNTLIPLNTSEVLADIKKCNSNIDPLNINPVYKYIKKSNKIKNFLIKAKKYLTVEINHAVNGSTPSAELKKRIKLCESCPGRVIEMYGETDPGKIGFCSLCGCGASRRAALSVKLTLAGAECPINKWYPVKGKEKIKWYNIKDAIKGIIYSIIDRIKI